MTMAHDYILTYSFVKNSVAIGEFAFVIVLETSLGTAHHLVAAYEVTSIAFREDGMP